MIADITDAKSIPQELGSIVEQLPSLAVQPILLKGAEPWGMYDHIRRYPWVLPVTRYESQDELIGLLEAKVIAPVEAKVTGSSSLRIRMVAKLKNVCARAIPNSEKM